MKRKHNKHKKENKKQQTVKCFILNVWFNSKKMQIITELKGITLKTKLYK